MHHREPSTLRDLEPADHAPAEPGERSFPGARVMDHAHLVEGRTEHGRVGDLAAEPAAYAGLVHVSDRIIAERVRVVLERERRAAVQAHARLVARADVGVHAEARYLHARAGLELSGDPRLHAALPLELALGAGDDHLEPAGGGGHRL